MALLVQFLAGMWVNLFVSIPAAHPGSRPPEHFAGSATSVAWAITSSGLPALVFHATWGLVLGFGSLALAASARRLRRHGITVAAVAGFLCVLGTGFNGGSFPDFDENFSSMLMASLFALAALADLVILNALAGD